MVSSGENFALIERPYLLVTNIPYYLDNSGSVFLDSAWHHDLIQHLQYIRDLTLAAPLCPLPASTTSLVRLDESLLASLKLVPLPPSVSRIRSIAQSFSAFYTLWRAIARAEIVHTGITGWPYPFGWLACAIAKFRNKKLLINVESAPWRLIYRPKDAAPIQRRIDAKVYEALAKYWCSRADLSFYTQPAYLRDFLAGSKRPAYVTPATWINAEDVFDDVQAEAEWDAKMSEPVRYLFAGRLVAEKGVRVLLEAAAKLTAGGTKCSIHFMGDGPLRDDILAAERLSQSGLRYIEPVPYPSFLRLLGQYHALIIPSLSDEQPRVIFDAAARAVPVLAADTDGLRTYVDDYHTGRLVPPGNSDALKEEMLRYANDVAALRGFGMEALSRMRSHTHQAMHAKRSQIIAHYLCNRLSSL